MSDEKNVKLAFITGITGQDGSYLSELLLSKGYRVYGIVRRTSLLYSHTRLDHIRKDIELTYGDLTDSSGLSNIIRNIINSNPDFETFEIYNLAAQSHVGILFQIPEYTTEVDAVGVLRILDIIKNLDCEARRKIKFYQAGTSELYGDVKENPQNEETPFNPISPYAIAKQYAYYITKNYRESYGIYAVNGILFNHESPRRGENFVTMKIINGVKAISKGEKEFIELGNLYSKRDWGHAKDYVYGMWLMMQQTPQTIKDYVLATNTTKSVKTFVEKAFKKINLDITWDGQDLNEVGKDQFGKIRVKVNPKYFRPHDVEYLLGDVTKAMLELKWDIEYNSLEKIIDDMFENNF